MSADPLAAQQFTEAVFNLIPVGESEDCLYLNVYAPSTPPSQNGRAVLFWIHGGNTRSNVKYERRYQLICFTGSLQFGTASQPAYDGSAFAAYQDVILVSVNYRTNGK